MGRKVGGGLYSVAVWVESETQIILGHACRRPLANVLNIKQRNYVHVKTSDPLDQKSVQYTKSNKTKNQKKWVNMQTQIIFTIIKAFDFRLRPRALHIHIT